MLRSLSRRLSSRLSPITLLSRASAEQPVSSSFAACVSGTRHLSADPVLDEDFRTADAAEAAAGRQAAHEQLVFELFGIRERLREQIKNREYGSGLPKRIRRADEPKLYAVPLRVLLNAIRSSGEGNGDVLLAWERQMEEENAALDATIERYKEGLQKMVDRGVGTDMTSAQRLMLGWFNPLRTAIAREQQAVLLNSQAGDRPGTHAYGPYLLLLDPDQLAVLTMHVVLTHLLGQYQNRAEAGQARLTDIAIVLGKAVQKQVGLEQLRVRVSEENAMRAGARKAWKRATKASGLAMDLDSSQRNSSADTLRDNPELLPLMEDTWQDMRGQQGLPEEVREWIEDLSDLHLKDRLLSIQNRVRERFKGQPQAARSKLKLRRSKDFAYEWDHWDTDKVVQVGTILVELFLRATEGTAVSSPRDGEEDVDNPNNRAFWHKTVFTERLNKTVGRTIRLKQGFIRCHDDILKELTSISQVGDLLLLHKYQPMLIPPLPWRSLDSGGHLLTRSFLCRIGNNHLLRNALIRAANTADGGLSQVYAALNAVGEVGWSINQPILEKIQSAYAKQAPEQPPICDLPRHYNVAMLSAKTARRFRTARTGTQLLAQATAEETLSEKRARRAVNEARRKGNREMHALRSDFELKLQVAEKFKQEPAIYFPHDLDFRGRAYPMHPHLNHMGPDVCRGLLCFAEAKPLGEQGFHWLLVQLANSWGRGVDKLPFKERRQFCERNLHNILDSASHPLDDTASRWWLGGEAPWQVLAACMEIRGALAWQEAWGTLATYPSRLPVQIDGSCNGLQHYAALGRDEPGGTAVNLAPSERPQDVYSEVARVVEGFVERDAARGLPEAIALQGMVDRKLVKQSVMTSVYGVTTLGARDQVAARLRERGWPNNHHLRKIAMYGAKTTLEGLGEKFSKAVAIMTWLAKCAKVVAAREHCVEWTTPLGLPVIQPYREKETHIVVTVLQRLKLQRDSAKMPVQKGRQKTAFPPNYIHSLDSSHMMLTALGCKREGIAFVGVHDSFWTHPGDVPVLNRVLREAFVDLHSRPLLEQLREELISRNPDVDPSAFPPIPSVGDLDLQEVLKSDYFFN